jgi:hypothetical protein
MFVISILAYSSSKCLRRISRNSNAHDRDWYTAVRQAKPYQDEATSGRLQKNAAAMRQTSYANLLESKGK